MWIQEYLLSFECIGWDTLTEETNRINDITDTDILYEWDKQMTWIW